MNKTLGCGGRICPGLKAKNNVNTYSNWPDSKSYTQPLGNVFELINTQNRTAFSPIILFCNILRLKMHDSISLLQQSLLS
jgi:hypothetical protein